MGAMHIGEDGFWHLGAILRLEASGYRSHEVKLHLRFKRQGDAFRRGREGSLAPLPAPAGIGYWGLPGDTPGTRLTGMPW